MAYMTRREALTAIAQLAAVAALAGCAPGGDETEAAGAGSDLELLASVSYDIMPYDSIDPAIYVKAAEGVLATGDQAVADGIARLRAVAGNTPWRDLEETRRIAALTAIEETPFFATIRGTTMNTLFAEQEVWDLVGYGGEALSKGGYIDRGFDDIDWLPENGGN